MFRTFSRPSSGAQWLQWQPLVLPSYRGDSRAAFVVGPASRPDHGSMNIRLHYAVSHDISILTVNGYELTFGRLIPSRARPFLAVAASSVALETPILLFLHVKREFAECEICRSDVRKPGALYQHWPQSVLKGAGVFWLQFYVALLIIVAKSLSSEMGKVKIQSVVCSVISLDSFCCIYCCGFPTLEIPADKLMSFHIQLRKFNWVTCINTWQVS
jgi:hypothetical protein